MGYIRRSGCGLSLIHIFTSNFRANELQRSVIVANRVKTVNKKIYYSINKIHEAIENGRKITFHYFNYDIKKRKIFRNADGRYTMSPYHLAWEDENYYCIGFYEKYNSVSNFRVDRMEDVEAVSYTHLDVYKRQGLLFICNGCEDDSIRCNEMCIRDRPRYL